MRKRDRHHDVVAAPEPARDHREVVSTALYVIAAMLMFLASLLEPPRAKRRKGCGCDERR